MIVLVKKEDGTTYHAELLMLDDNGVDWSKDFIGNSGAFNTPLDNDDCYLVREDDYLWWQDAIACEDEFSEISDALKEVTDLDDRNWYKVYDDLVNGDYCLNGIDVADSLRHLIPHGMVLVRWSDGSWGVHPHGTDLSRNSRVLESSLAS